MGEVGFQAPGEDLDWSHDWSNELDSQGSPSDTIASSSWTLTGPDGDGSPSPSANGAVVQGSVTSVFVQDLAPGNVYRLTNTIVTGAGRRLTHSWTLRCGNW